MLPSIAHLSSAHVHTTGAVPFTTKGSFQWQHPSYGVEASTTSHSAGAGAGSGSMDSSGRAAPAAHAIHQFMHSTAAAQAGAIKLDADADAEVAAQTRHQAVSAMSPASGGKGSPPPTLPRGERGERGGGDACATRPAGTRVRTRVSCWKSRGTAPRKAHAVGKS